MRDDEVFARRAGAFCVLIAVVCWSVNLYKLINECDFFSPYKCEAVHLMGVIIPPASLFTVWADVGQ